MDILTVENNNIKIISLFLTRFITNEHYKNNCALLEIFMDDNQDIAINNYSNVSFYLNNILILEDCKILQISKNEQSKKYNIYIKEK